MSDTHLREVERRSSLSGTGGNEFNFDIPTVSKVPLRERCAPVVQSWDPAYTVGPDSAFSACTTWGYHESKWYLLDAWRGKLQFPDLFRKVVAHRARWQADHIVIEGAGSGTQLVQQLKRDGHHRNVMACKLGVGNKEALLIEQSARLTGGNFVIPSTASWFGDLRREFRAFPNGKYADQVDCVSQFVTWASSGRGSHDRNRQTGSPSYGTRNTSALGVQTEA